MKQITVVIITLISTCLPQCLRAQGKEIAKAALHAVAPEQIIPRNTRPTVAELLQRTLEFQQQYGGALPKRTLYTHGRPISTQDMNEAQLSEVRLARQVYRQLNMVPLPQDPVWQQLSVLYSAAQSEPMPTPKVFLTQLTAWMEKHKGFRPRLQVYENGVALTAEELKQVPGLYEEHTLARRLDYFLKYAVLDEQTRRKLAAIRKLPTITRQENPTDTQFYDYFHNSLPAVEKTVNQIEQWSAAHGNTRPRVLFFHKGKRISVAKLTPEQYEEYQLGARLQYFMNKKNIPTALWKRLIRLNTLPACNLNKTVENP